MKNDLILFCLICPPFLIKIRKNCEKTCKRQKILHSGSETLAVSNMHYTYAWPWEYTQEKVISNHKSNFVILLFEMRVIEDSNLGPFDHGAPALPSELPCFGTLIIINGIKIYKLWQIKFDKWKKLINFLWSHSVSWQIKKCDPQHKKWATITPLHSCPNSSFFNSRNT